jgi:chemotaxis protein methyltransferase CheR
MRSSPGQALRYQLALHLEKRESFTFTQFLRLPTQYEALAGPVLTMLGWPVWTDPLTIVVAGCSTGAEPYTISSVLQREAPNLRFMVDAFDCDETALETASGGAYLRDNVLGNRFMSSAFVSDTFDERADQLAVKQKVAERVHLSRRDLLDPGLTRTLPPADIVFAQNILCNMTRPLARQAFHRISALVKPAGVLFIDGVDLDMRSSLTRACKFQPLDYEVERIHNEARAIRGERYPWYATGLEPFNGRRKDWLRRYATIFYRGKMS